jgi:hypothetical protein
VKASPKKEEEEIWTERDLGIIRPSQFIGIQSRFSDQHVRLNPTVGTDQIMLVHR